MCGCSVVVGGFWGVCVCVFRCFFFVLVSLGVFYIGEQKLIFLLSCCLSFASTYLGKAMKFLNSHTSAF